MARALGTGAGLAVTQGRVNPQSRMTILKRRFRRTAVAEVQPAAAAVVQPHRSRIMLSGELFVKRMARSSTATVRIRRGGTMH